jgi:hypothetical protein
MDSQQKLKVVSIVGFGGLGKTTLAKQVYDQIGGQFDCKAFVSVSQRPDVKTLLIGLQLKLGMGESSHSRDLQDIIDYLREYLKHKRYILFYRSTHSYTSAVKYSIIVWFDQALLNISSMYDLM